MSALGRLGLIGAGRLGQTWACACAAAGHRFEAVHSRRIESAQGLEKTIGARVKDTAQEVVDACDTVFLTVSDDAIERVCASLNWRAGQVAVHCSGATELGALAHAVQQGAVAAGLHPLHTFGDVETALAGLPGSAAAVEATQPSVQEALTALARDVGLRPFVLPSGTRSLYHASSHYAGSLVVTLLDEALRHWSHLGVTPEQALAALLPLLRSTVRAIEAKGTGPGMAGVVARGDEGVLDLHLRALEVVGRDEERLYAELSLRSVRLALEAGRIDEAKAQAMRERLYQTLARPAPR